MSRPNSKQWLAKARLKNKDLNHEAEVLMEQENLLFRGGKGAIIAGDIQQLSPGQLCRVFDKLRTGELRYRSALTFASK